MDSENGVFFCCWKLDQIARMCLDVASRHTALNTPFLLIPFAPARFLLYNSEREYICLV